MKKEIDIAIEFNEFSKNYTNDMIGCVPYYLQLISSFVKHLPNDFSPNSILDLGCGNGNVSSQLVSFFPKASFTLVDASSEMIDLCRKQFSAFDINYSTQYFKDFAFKADSYDLIVAGFSLHHCSDREKQSIFKAIYSALKQDGIFAYSDLMISKSNPDHPLLLKKWKKFVHKTFPDGKKWTWLLEHYETFDRPTDYALQIEWMKEAGFTDIQIPFKKEYWVYLQAIK